METAEEKDDGDEEEEEEEDVLQNIDGYKADKKDPFPAGCLLFKIRAFIAKVLINCILLSGSFTHVLSCAGSSYTPCETLLERMLRRHRHRRTGAGCLC